MIDFHFEWHASKYDDNKKIYWLLPRENFVAMISVGIYTNSFIRLSTIYREYCRKNLIQCHTFLKFYGNYFYKGECVTWYQLVPNIVTYCTVNFGYSYVHKRSVSTLLRIDRVYYQWYFSCFSFRIFVTLSTLVHILSCNNYTI